MTDLVRGLSFNLYLCIQMDLYHVKNIFMRLFCLQIKLYILVNIHIIIKLTKNILLCFCHFGNSIDYITTGLTLHYLVLPMFNFIKD